jgi:hypothetical protein
MEGGRSDQSTSWLTRAISEPGQAGQEAEQRALGEELADQPSAARPQRDADGDLARAGSRRGPGAGFATLAQAMSSTSAHHAHEHGAGQRRRRGGTRVEPVRE